MNHRQPPKPPHFDLAPEGTCRWCNQSTGNTKTGKPSKSRWHKECLKEYKLIHWPSTTRRAVWNRDKGICKSCHHQCDKKGKNGWHMDHITPLIEADQNIKFWLLPNLQTLCHQCHKDKTAKEATQRAITRKALKELK